MARVNKMEDANRISELEAAIDRMLTGGNHLASALISWLGAGAGFPAYTVSFESAREVLKDPNMYDAWVCWRTIMQERDALGETLTPVNPKD